jgi:hypothetical protein
MWWLAAVWLHIKTAQHCKAVPLIQWDESMVCCLKAQWQLLLVC